MAKQTSDDSTPAAAVTQPPGDVQTSAGGDGLGDAQVNIGIADVTAGIAAATDRNVSVSPAAQQAAADDWKSEPIENFETTFLGGVKMRDDGSPIRREGRPAKPRPGDELADGTVYGDSTAPESDGVNDPLGDSPAHDSLPDDSAPLTQDAADVLCDGVFRTITGLFGDWAQPTDSESAAIKQAAGRVLGGVRVPPWLALVITVAAYVVRIFVSRKPKEPPANASKSPVNSGPDNGRQNDPGQAAYPRYAGEPSA